MKRFQAFSLLEVSIVLLIIGGVMVTVIPLLSRFQKQYEAKAQIEIALKSLGAYVAVNNALPLPDSIRSDGDIIRGDLPYKKLGIPKKGPTILYAVDKKLTDTHANYDFCSQNLKNHFGYNVEIKNDLDAFELVSGTFKIVMTRNNFYAQYCGGVCKAQVISENVKRGSEII